MHSGDNRMQSVQLVAVVHSSLASKVNQITPCLLYTM